MWVSCKVLIIMGTFLFWDVTQHTFVVCYQYSHTPHNNISFDDGPHIQWWSHKIIILQYSIIILVFYQYSHAPHNNISFDDGPHIRRWSHKIIIL